MQIAERIGEAHTQKLAELPALLVRETRVAAIGARVLQVDLIMRNVQIAADHHGFRISGFACTGARQPRCRDMARAQHDLAGVDIRAVLAFACARVGQQHDGSFTIDALDRHASRQNALFQAFAEVAERVIPLHAVIDARQTVLGIRRVHAHEPAFRELQRHDATFIVEVRKPQAVKHLQRSPLAENRRSRIAFSVGVTPKLQVIRQVGGSLVRLQLRLLQGKHIGVDLGDDVLEALLHHRAQAVDVP